MSKPLTIYFLCETYTGYRNFFMRRVPEPEGLPPLYNTWNGYADRGHRVHVFSQDFMYDTYENWMHHGKQMHNIPVPGRYLRKARNTLAGKTLFRFARLWGLASLWRRVKRVAAQDPPDVVYSCSPWCTLVACQAAKKFNAVHTVRRFGTVLYERMQGKSMGLQDSLYIEALGYRLSFDLLVMGNDGTYGDRVARHYGCPPQKLRFWTNGIDKELYSVDFDRAAFRRQLGVAEDAPLILSLSRLAGWKRLDRALEMMRRVKSVRPDARLVIVGTGELEEQLKSLAVTLAVDDVVRFVGPVGHRYVGDYYNGCDIYVQFFDLTNRCNPLFEAMVCAMPVVTLTDPSIDDVVIDQRNALRVDKADMERAAKHVIELLADSERCRELGAAARQHILAKFKTWPARIGMEVDEVLKLVRAKKHGR